MRTRIYHIQMSMPIILFMLTTNILEEHCHHTQDCTFSHFFSQTNKSHKIMKKKEKEIETVNAAESRYIIGINSSNRR